MHIEDEPPPGAPTWLVTFSDLVSLLVTLFIMLLTFTTQETDRLQKVMAMIKGSFGFNQEVKNRPAFVEELSQTELSPKGVTTPRLNIDPSVETRVLELKSFYLEAADFDAGVKIIPEIQGAFGPGDDRPSLELESECRHLARKLKKDLKRIYSIVGHTDRQSDEKNPFGDHQVLSLMRARRIARIFGLEGIPLETVSIVSAGELEPRTRGGTAEDQARNRRVEIIVRIAKAERIKRGR